MTNSAHDINIVISDDHPIVLLAISASLNAVPRFRVCATARSGTELVDTLARVQCDLIVTDFTMQTTEADEDGLRLIGRLRRLYPKTPVVVFTMLTNGGILHQLCQLGVAGIAGKDEEIETLAQVCQRALYAHRTVLSPRITTRLAHEGTIADALRTQPLSPRELEVVRLFVLGLSVTEIARRLNRAVATVATQKRAAMRKLHLETNADLVRYASEQGLF